jgi:hypothetical protein
MKTSRYTATGEMTPGRRARATGPGSRGGRVWCQAVGVIRRRRVRPAPTRSVWARQELRRVHRAFRYWVPKGRCRQAWVHWADDSREMDDEAIRDAEWQHQANGEPSSMVLMTVHDERLHGPVPQEVTGDVPKSR